MVFLNLMTKFIIAQKLNMSQMFTKDGKVVPVTILKAGPVKVVQIRTMEKDKYQAVQLGFGKKAKASKAETGHGKELGAFKTLTEFRVADSNAYTRGQ